MGRREGGRVPSTWDLPVTGRRSIYRRRIPRAVHNRRRPPCPPPDHSPRLASHRNRRAGPVTARPRARRTLCSPTGEGNRVETRPRDAGRAGQWEPAGDGRPPVAVGDFLGRRALMHRPGETARVSSSFHSLIRPRTWAGLTGWAAQAARSDGTPPAAQTPCPTGLSSAPIGRAPPPSRCGAREAAAVARRCAVRGIESHRPPFGQPARGRGPPGCKWKKWVHAAHRDNCHAGAGDLPRAPAPATGERHRAAPSPGTLRRASSFRRGHSRASVRRRFCIGPRRGDEPGPIAGLVDQVVGASSGKGVKGGGGPAEPPHRLARPPYGQPCMSGGPATTLGSVCGVRVGIAR